MDEDVRLRKEMNLRENPRRTVYEEQLLKNCVNPLTGKPYLTTFRGFSDNGEAIYDYTGVMNRDYSSFVETENKDESIFKKEDHVVRIPNTEFIRYALSLRQMDRRTFVSKNYYDSQATEINSLVVKYNRAGLGLDAITDMGGLDNALEDLERRGVPFRSENTWKEDYILARSKESKIISLINREDEFPFMGSGPSRGIPTYCLKELRRFK